MAKEYETERASGPIQLALAAASLLAVIGLILSSFFLLPALSELWLEGSDLRGNAAFHLLDAAHCLYMHETSLAYVECVDV